LSASAAPGRWSIGEVADHLRLAEGLYRLRGADLTAIVNTGDDFDYLGLLVSPDVDTMLYALAGIADAAKGWEPAGETFACHAMLMRLRGPGDVPLGDRALALRRLLFGMYALIKVHLAEEEEYLRIVEHGVSEDSAAILAAAMEHPVR